MENNIGAEVLKSFQQDPDKVFLRSYSSGRNYTGSMAISTIQKIATSLIAEGQDQMSRVAIFSQNCPEWTLVDLACIQARIISVPIFATNNYVQTEFILKDSGSQLVFAGSKEQYNELLKIKNKEEYRIIVFDDQVDLKTENSIYFKDWFELYDDQNLNDDLKKRTASIKESDLTTLIYTSGTTGEPKGVQVHHSQFNALLANHNEVYEFKPSYTSLAFLPLSHVYERSWTYIILSNGMSNVYLSNPKVIASAIEKIKPETFCAVPRLYEKIHGKIMDEISKQSSITQNVFNWALKQGKKHSEFIQNKQKVPALLSLKHKLADRLVFKTIRAKLGGNIVYCPCGGAYISDHLVEFFRAINIPLLVGYGLTESTATVTSFTNEDYRVGSVGKPIVNVDLKIGENNEILVKGKTITSGYYQLEEESKERFTEDGWFKTGDAGRLDEDGFLYITDRIKQLIKTANGKYIAPQLVEGRLAQSRFIAQAMIIGEGRSYVSGLFTLDQEYVEEWAKEQGINYDNFEGLAQNQDLLKAINTSINEEQKDLSNYEKVKRFRVLAHEFSMEKDELTPTLKLKRKVIEKNYADLINTLYK
ncbi:long-chain fatty acid--CoA ligase [Weeksellaceae bacterium KMM 9724]|uniref:AMP-dependent synthetase/ligase n=1 Tax=Profundicola chukchiensis TaxID=2961959 RepID=UPI00243CEEEE|nr:long-chain fatty acid--CoA ligase [Profundicola chukchiensis]MDG4950179.1 long-chain fatty acid--CoA ligase [Profundicola chukchiensis]